MSQEFFIQTKSQLCQSLNKIGNIFNQGYGFPTSLIPLITEHFEFNMIDDFIINGSYKPGSLEPLLLITNDLLIIKNHVSFPIFMFVQQNPKHIILSYGEK